MHFLCLSHGKKLLLDADRQEELEEVLVPRGNVKRSLGPFNRWLMHEIGAGIRGTCLL